jgi:hypothetical protein
MSNQYLARHAEPEAAHYAALLAGRHYSNSLVIPAYKEVPAFLAGLSEWISGQQAALVILVLNRPDSADSDCNSPLRTAVRALPCLEGDLYRLPGDSELLLVEREAPLPAAEGVGLARKIGCDIALALRDACIVKSAWLHTSDADARLPQRYFSSAEEITGAIAISRPFRHDIPDEPAAALPIYLYELRLHYYVLGLRAAGSPYAFQTVGSCISVRADAYAAVRGFPRRSGAEDFYLLNKLAKTGTIASPAEPALELSGRVSDRVPFGTGAAVTRLSDAEDPRTEALFYHPECFVALGQLLEGLEALHGGVSTSQLLPAYAAAVEVLEDLGIGAALDHCRSHARNSEAFARHFHQWFDGFRTLKFVHGLRERGFEDMDIADSRACEHSIWPENWEFREDLLKQ